jgi:hypothetical protein
MLILGSPGTQYSVGAVPAAWVLTGSAAASIPAQSPKNAGVTFNGETDGIDPLAPDVWHTITARYRYVGHINVLTNSFLAIARGNDPRTGFYVGYNVATNQLMIVKHGHWNATEATGLPGATGKIIENDQGYIDCENTRVEKTADDLAVAYRVKFKKGVLKGACNVFMYVEDKDVKHDGFTNIGTVTLDEDTVAHRTDMPASWQNALRPKGAPAEQMTLADNGKAQYVVVIPRNARRIEKKAANDLCLYVRLASGAALPIVGEDRLPAGDRPYISIGRTGLLARSSCRWKGADLAVEGYALETEGKNVYLYGGSGRGLIHGVYSMLEEDLGCRWYSPTSADTPRVKRLAVSLAPRKYLPVLELRDPYIHKMHDPNWSLRNKTNTPHARVPLAWGGSIRYHHMGHTYAAYFPTEQYFAAHPEYYALVNGKRQPSQLCHTNEDVIRLSVQKTCEIFRTRPEVTVTAIGPNDGRGFCDCPDCRRLDDENGGRSGSFFHHVNRIAEGVKKEFPNNHLICLAYLDYAHPPKKLKVDDYVIVQLCTDSHAWKHQFCFVWESKEFQEALKAWHAAKAKVFIWDYTTDYVHYLVPMANWPVVAENTRFNIRHGAAGIMYESELNDVDEMRGWVWAKQLWNPELDTKALMRDFVFGYYKEAAQPIWEYQMMMWAYWERWHALPHTCGQPSDNPLLDNLHCSYAPDGPMFTAEFMANMRKHFSQAEGMAKSDEILSRVKKAKLPLVYLELSQNLGYYTEFGDFVYGKSIRQPRAGKQAFQPKLDEFVALCKEHELTALGIPVTVEKIAGKWRSCIDAESAALPKVYLPSDWIFKADSEDRGVRNKWYADPKYYDAAVQLSDRSARGETSTPPLETGLSRLHINRGVGWEQQGFPGLDGYGWYFQSIAVPDELIGKKHLYLYFIGVNEQAWVYVNGELAFERSYATTRKGVGELSGSPFSFDAKRWLKPRVRNHVAVRVTHASGLGGIWLPAMLVGADEERSTGQLDKYRY